MDNLKKFFFQKFKNMVYLKKEYVCLYYTYTIIFSYLLFPLLDTKNK